MMCAKPRLIRRSSRRDLLHTGVACALAPLVGNPVAVLAADGFPNRPIRLVIPWTVGGSADTIGRLLAQVMSADLGQSVIVENKPGGSGTIGHATVAQARPDGHTILFATNSTYAMVPHLFDKLPYDNDKAFAPIGLATRSPQILCAYPGVPVKDIAGFFVWVRANQPDGVTFSSSGPGSSSHLAAEMLMSMANFQMVHVPYRGGGPASQALIAGEVKVGFTDAVLAKPFAQAGRLRLLGVSTTERVGLLPDLPTIAESGVEGFQSSTDMAFFAPAGTPADVIARLNKAVVSALRSSEVRKVLEGQGVAIVAGSPEGFGAYRDDESRKWGEVIRSRGIKV